MAGEEEVKRERGLAEASQPVPLMGARLGGGGWAALERERRGEFAFDILAFYKRDRRTHPAATRIAHKRTLPFGTGQNARKSTFSLCSIEHLHPLSCWALKKTLTNRCQCAFSLFLEP